jgi:hypothetical protein
VVLVLRRVDSRYLALAECIVEGVIDLTNREPEPSRAAAVDDQIRLKPVQLLVESDPLQKRHVFQSGLDFRSPLGNVFGVVGQ